MNLKEGPATRETSMRSTYFGIYFADMYVQEGKRVKNR